MKKYFYFLFICLVSYSCNLKEVDPPIAPLTKTFGNKSFTVSSIDDVGEYVFENSEGNFVIVGASFNTWAAGDGNGIIITLDTNGDTISPTRYNLGGPKFTYCTDGLELPSNKQYMLTGMKLDESINKRQTFLDRLDGSGMNVTGFPKPMQTPNNSWGKKIFYSEDDQSIRLLGTEYATSKYCDAGIFIEKLDLNGNSLPDSRRSIFSGTSTSRELQKAIKAPNDDSFYLLGIKYDCTQSDYGNLFLAKIDANGNVLLPPVDFGSNGSDAPRGFYLSEDGGIVFLGATERNGSLDIWIFKTDTQGKNISTDTVFGKSVYNDNPFAIEKTKDGGCIVAAYTNDPSNGNNGGEDIVLYKLDANLRLQWKKCYGTVQNDQPRSIKQTSDGGYIVVGFTDNNIGGKGLDVLAFKIDQNGEF